MLGRSKAYSATSRFASTSRRISRSVVSGKARSAARSCSGSKSRGLQHRRRYRACLHLLLHILTVARVGLKGCLHSMHLILMPRQVGPQSPGPSSVTGFAASIGTDLPSARWRAHCGQPGSSVGRVDPRAAFAGPVLPGHQTHGRGHRATANGFLRGERGASRGRR
jgi:hypothetical protein